MRERKIFFLQWKGRMNYRRERHSKFDLNFADRLKRGKTGSYGKD